MHSIVTSEIASANWLDDIYFLAPSNYFHSYGNKLWTYASEFYVGLLLFTSLVCIQVFAGTFSHFTRN